MKTVNLIIIAFTVVMLAAFAGIIAEKSIPNFIISNPQKIICVNGYEYQLIIDVNNIPKICK